MRVLLDTCVLSPTVLRQILIGACAAGLARPLWSSRPSSVLDRFGLETTVAANEASACLMRTLAPMLASSHWRTFSAGECLRTLRFAATTPVSVTFGLAV